MPKGDCRAVPFYERGAVRIRYEEVGSGFPLLVTPGGGLNSRVSNWPTAVFNAMEAFKGDFRCITMEQRNANGGESTGPTPTSDPWGAFADDQLGLMDYLGAQTPIRRAWTLPRSRRRRSRRYSPGESPKDLLEKTIDQVRTFLRSREPR